MIARRFFSAFAYTTASIVAVYVAAVSGLYLQQLRANVALVEYLGYQDDSTQPSQESFTSNSKVAYDWLRNQNHSKLPVFILGRSLGTGIATYLASVRPAPLKRVQGPGSVSRDSWREPS